MANLDLFVFAGEASGDLHGEKLLKALHQKLPSLKISGVGGPKMREAGMDCIMPMENFQVMGFVDVFIALPKLMRQFFAVRRAILESNPKAVLFIDYPGFNLRMAKHLRKKGYKGKLIHYICPSVWAWGKKRIPLMENTLDLLLTFFPFEVECFSQTSLSVKHVGHPLVSRIQNHAYRKLKLPKGHRIIGIFPGSRKKELDRNFDIQLSVAKKLLEEFPDLFFPISLSQEKYRPLLEQKIQDWGLQEKTLLVPSERSYDLMRECHLAIAKSGTVNLELALHEVPTVVTYGISKLDLFITRDILKIRLPHYCIVNIAYTGLVFPELFGPNLTEDALYGHVKNWLMDPSAKTECQKKCSNLRELLSNADASLEAARQISAALPDLPRF